MDFLLVEGYYQEELLEGLLVDVPLGCAHGGWWLIEWSLTVAEIGIHNLVSKLGR
jgi:hypothetical protein